MLYEIPFQARHILDLDLQPAQKGITSYLNLDNLKTLENEWAVTVMERGVPALCAGTIVYWDNRAYLWSFVSSRVTRYNFIEVHRIARRYLLGLPFRRVEATVDVDFPAGHRWLRLLGFTLEAERMQAFQVDGRDCALYARVRD